MAKLFILRPGPLSLVQDKGRFRHQHLGLSQGGAADGYAFFWANYLLDNPGDAAIIEITLGPFEARFSGDTVISLCGAEMDCRINDKHAANWSTHRIASGDIIRLNIARNGLRGYLGVRGGIRTPKLFGSRSIVLREEFSGFHGQPLNRSSAVEYVSDPATSQWINRCVPWNYVPPYTNEIELRIVPGYQFHDFSASAIKTFTSGSYRISPHSNRMGYRLEGESIAWRKGDIISEGTAYGSVQIPPDGQPIVLLNDRQTMGGYPKVGCVCRADCYQLAQRKPGDRVIFRIWEKDDVG